LVPVGVRVLADVGKARHPCFRSIIAVLAGGRSKERLSRRFASPPAAIRDSRADIY
jgi:hypothetical protein